MLKLLKTFWEDEYGVILSTEIVIIGTVLVLGLLTGMVCLQKSVNSELGDFAKAIGCIDQSYSFSGQRKACQNGSGFCSAFTAGSAFNNDACTNLCKYDIIGCECSSLQAGSCEQCGAPCGAVGVCGSCGHPGTAGVPFDNRPDCVSTGVPNMRVTEYPFTSNVPRTSNAGKSAIRFPALEVQPTDPACRQPVQADPGQYEFPQQQHLYPQDAESYEQVPEQQIPLQRPPLYQYSPDTDQPPQEQVSPVDPGSGGQLRPVPQTEPVPPIPFTEPQGESNL